MTTVSIRAQVEVPAELLWEMVGRFNTMGQWHPMVRRSQTHGEGKGALRKLRLIDGAIMIERLEHVSDAERVYLFSLVEGPLPVAHCVSEIRVTDRGDGTSTVEWSSNFVPAGVPEPEAIKALEDVYSKGLENVKKIYGSLPPDAARGIATP